MSNVKCELASAADDLIPDATLLEVSFKGPYISTTDREVLFERMVARLREEFGEIWAYAKSAATRIKIYLSGDPESVERAKQIILGTPGIALA